MIEMMGNSAQNSNSAHRQNLTKVVNKNMEEMIIERGVITVFKALVRNTNSIVYEVKNNSVLYSNRFKFLEYS